MNNWKNKIAYKIFNTILKSKTQWTLKHLVNKIILKSHMIIFMMKIIKLEMNNHWLIAKEVYNRYIMNNIWAIIN